MWRKVYALVLPVWVLVWVFRWSDLENFLWQVLHWKGFTPEETKKTLFLYPNTFWKGEWNQLFLNFQKPGFFCTPENGVCTENNMLNVDWTHKWFWLSWNISPSKWFTGLSRTQTHSRLLVHSPLYVNCCTLSRLLLQSNQPDLWRVFPCCS